MLAGTLTCLHDHQGATKTDTPNPIGGRLMAKRQHILVLCVAALLLTAGCNADDASDATAAAAQAAATPDVPQTSTNIAQADPDGVTVAQQSNREKVSHSRSRTSPL